MDEETSARIVALETKLAYMEDFVNQLQAVCVGHTHIIDLLRGENRLLSQKIRDMAAQMEDDVPSRRPPHY